jgi:hypothetical protein
MRVMWMPLSTAWAPPSADATFCCAGMRDALAFACDQHADPFECGDGIVVYNEVFDEFGLIVHDGGQSYVLIQHCPWCATRLPESQRDRWFDEMEAKNIDEENPPLAYTTREWRLNELKS